MLAKLMIWATDIFNAFSETVTDALDNMVTKVVKTMTDYARIFISRYNLTHSLDVSKRIIKSSIVVVILGLSFYQMITLVPMFLYFIPTYVAFRILMTLSNKIVSSLM